MNYHTGKSELPSDGLKRVLRYLHVLHTVDRTSYVLSGYSITGVRGVSSMNERITGGSDTYTSNQVCGTYCSCGSWLEHRSSEKWHYNTVFNRSVIATHCRVFNKSVYQSYIYIYIYIYLYVCGSQCDPLSMGDIFHIEKCI